MKLLLYIVFIVGIFYFLQNKFNLFDVSFVDDLKISNLLKENKDVVDTQDTIQNLQIDIGGGKLVNLKVEIVDTPEERELGLSHRTLLGDYEGMYFVFEQNTNSSFWMRDMLIPLDMVFVDEGGIIVDIKENLQPCTNTCPSVFSGTTYRYVLEVNSGFCSTNDVKIGDSVLVNFK